MADQQWDLLIQHALIFDGSGDAPVEQDLAVDKGIIVARGVSLPVSNAVTTVDASGQWLTPGLMDIHTHLDLEVELEPGLAEVVRHGTTSVIIGNCSLGLAFGSQERNGESPIVDCFTRVENIPKSVLRKTIEQVDWDNSADYLDHFDKLAVGPNIAALLPHSMLRVEVMGLQESVSREPSDAELTAMEGLLNDAMKQGYVGLSTDGLPFHYLANDPNTDKRIPTQFAKFGELKRLLHVVRSHDRVWQTTPIIENKIKGLLYFMLSSGRLFGRRLKTSALSAMEFVLAPKITNSMLKLAGLINSRWLDGHIHFQALGTNFRIWSDGIVSPIFEEMDSTCQLIAKEYDDVDGRLALLNDPEFINNFRKDWHFGRKGKTLATFKAKLGLPDSMVIRDLDRMIFDGAPIKEWDSESLQQVFDRLEKFQSGHSSSARSDEEASAFEKFPKPILDDADFMLHMMREYDKKFRYWSDVANVGNKKTLDLLLHKYTLPGFNDSGAHITNMAFFDTNLMSLKLAQQESMATVSAIVKRLTREPAEFFGLDTGTLNIGAQADIVLINPEALKTWDTNNTRQLHYRDIFQHQQLVNRSEGIVDKVYINGECAWENGAPGEALGNKKLGKILRAK